MRGLHLPFTGERSQVVGEKLLRRDNSHKKKKKTISYCNRNCCANKFPTELHCSLQKTVDESTPSTINQANGVTVIVAEKENQERVLQKFDPSAFFHPALYKLRDPQSIPYRRSHCNIETRADKPLNVRVRATTDSPSNAADTLYHETPQRALHFDSAERAEEHVHRLASFYHPFSSLVQLTTQQLLVFLACL